MQFTRKKKIASAAAVGAMALATGGVAIAFFTGNSGSSDGNGSIGTGTAWSVVVDAPTGGSTGQSGALLPGGPAQHFAYHITNTSDGDQALTSVVDSIPTFAPGNVDVENASGADVSGCLQSWFTITPGTTPTLSASIAPGATVDGSFTVTLDDKPTNQDVCKAKGTAPKVTVTAS